MHRPLRFASRSASSLGRLVAIFLLLTAAVTCVAQAGVLSQDARRDLELRPGVVYVLVQATGRIPVQNGGKVVVLKCRQPAAASGSGFLYRPDGYLITNGHVAQLANSKDEEAVDAQKKFVFQGCFQGILEQAFRHQFTDAEVNSVSRNVVVDDTELTVVLDNGKPYDGEIKAYSGPITSSPNGKDVAIIKIDGNNLPTVPLGDSNAVNVNDHIWAIGYPGAADISKSSALVATTSEGIISALKAKDYSSTPLLQTTTNINHGSSGGPAFDEGGKVIGITTMGTEPGYNFLVPMSTAMEFVHQAGVEPQRGAFDKLWSQALDAYYNKEWTKAHGLLTEALEMFPNQPDARRLQAQAAANIPFESSWQRFQNSVGTSGMMGMVAAIVLLAGLLIWFLVRKPAQPVPVPAMSRVASASAAAAAPVLSATRIAEPPPQLASSSAPKAEQSYGSLIVSGGPLTGNRFQVTKAGLTIGRDPAKCSVVVADDSVSKEHAWIVPVDDGVAVIDRNSANGTYVNSLDSPRINKVILRHGDRVFLGKSSPTVFTYYSS